MGGCKVLLIALAGAVAASCAAVNPNPPRPDCGSPVRINEVRVVDLTQRGRHPDQLEAAVRDEVGDFRLVTTEPIWVPGKNASWSRGNVRGIVGVQTEAASWGCTLVLLLDTRMARTEVLVQSRNEEKVWLVHAGLLEAPR